MHVSEILIFEGRNIYSHRPVARVTLELQELTDRETREFPNFNTKLIATLPGLKTHSCSGREGGFEARLARGTYFGHVLEHIVLELQSQLGYSRSFGKTKHAGIQGTYHVVFEYGLSALVKPLVGLATELVQSLLDNMTFDLDSRLLKLKQIAAEAELGPSTKAIVEVARERGISVRRLGPDSLVQLGTGKHLRRVQATVGPHTSCIAADIACDKGMTKLVLSKAGIPVPFGITVSSREEAVEAWRLVSRPVAVKPIDGNQGKGVSLNIDSEHEVKAAFDLALRYGPRVIVEEYIEGKHYRLLVVGNKLVAASQRIPAHVTGDGQHSISELVSIINQDPRRGEKHEKPLTKMHLDELSVSVLRKQGFTTDAVPAEGMRVYLRDSANLSTGGSAIDVTDRVHASISALAVRVARLIGLDIAGIDLVTEDITHPLTPGAGSVIEVNAAPGIRMHLYPSEGQARDVASTIVDFLYPHGQPSEIPLIAVTGTNGKTTTTRLIAAGLRKTHSNVGMTTSMGIYLNDHLLVSGDTTGPWSANVVLADPIVDAAVLEVARGGIIRGGLGYDLADVAVITNISDDHVGQDGVNSLDELAHVKGLVSEAVRKDGSVVVNALDPLCLRLGVESKRNQVVFAGQINHSLLQHLSCGGHAVYCEKEELVFARGSEVHKRISLAKVPLTFGGAAYHNIENCAAAGAALWALGGELAHIEATLCEFLPDFKFNPGRQNFLQINGQSVMIDYGHNVAGIKATGELCKKVCSGRLIGVVCAPGDRSDDSICALGRAASEFFDFVVIKEDKDLRGRSKGSAAELIRQGLLEGGLTEERVNVVLDEEKALLQAFEEARAEDLVVIFYESLDLTMKILSQIEVSNKEKQKQMVVAGAVVR